jgi:hypothetical protein
MACGTALRLRIAGGRIYLDRDLYDRYFRGIESAVLLADGRDLLILPVASVASGGYLMKLRNSRGDRVIDAADTLRENGLEEAREHTPAVRWSALQAALRVPALFPLRATLVN